MIWRLCSLLVLVPLTVRGDGPPVLASTASQPQVQAEVPEGRTWSIVVDNADMAPVQWLRNGLPLAGATSQVLTISPVQPSSAGLYVAQIGSVGSQHQSQELALTVEPQPRLLNMSARVNVRPGDGPTILGLVVTSQPYSKRLLIRAVGPTLNLFGVLHPLPHPRLAVFDAYGRSVAFTASANGNEDIAIAAATKKAGAFPFPDGSSDISGILYTTGSSTYTIAVSSGDNSEGTVLVEVYEVPIPY